MTGGAARNPAAGRSVAWPASRRWQGGRPYQEDHYGVLNFDVAGKPPALLMILADGMGGAAGGARASRAVVEAFAAGFPHSDGPVDARLRQCLDDAVAGLADIVAADPDLAGMGSTVVAAQYDGQGIAWLSVGDSPMWLYADGKLERLNADHSMVPVLDRLVATGELSAEEARYDQRRNMLRSAVTDEAPELIDCAERSCRLGPGDYLLIASDGIETVSTDGIADILAAGAAGGDAERAADALMAAVRAEAGPAQDNATFLLLPGPPAPAAPAAPAVAAAPADAPAGTATRTPTGISTGTGASRRRRVGTIAAIAMLAAAVILLGALLVYRVAAPPAGESAPPVAADPAADRDADRAEPAAGGGAKDAAGKADPGPVPRQRPAQVEGDAGKDGATPAPRQPAAQQEPKPGGAAKQDSGAAAPKDADAAPKESGAAEKEESGTAPAGDGASDR